MDLLRSVSLFCRRSLTVRSGRIRAVALAAARRLEVGERGVSVGPLGKRLLLRTELAADGEFQGDLRLHGLAGEPVALLTQAAASHQSKRLGQRLQRQQRDGQQRSVESVHRPVLPTATGLAAGQPVIKAAIARA